MQLKHTYTRISVFMLDFIKKAINTDYLNIEPQPKQKIMGKGAQGVSGNYEGAEMVSTTSLRLLIVVLGVFSYGTVIFMLDWKVLAVTFAMFVEDVALRTYAIKYSDAHREESSEIWRKKNYIKQKSFNVSAGKDIRIYQLGKWFNSLFVGIIKARAKFEKKQQLVWFYPTLSGMFFNFARNILACRKSKL